MFNSAYPVSFPSFSLLYTDLGFSFGLWDFEGVCGVFKCWQIVSEN